MTSYQLSPSAKPPLALSTMCYIQSCKFIVILGLLHLHLLTSGTQTIIKKIPNIVVVVVVVLRDLVGRLLFKHP